MLQKLFTQSKSNGQNLTELGLVCGLVILTCVLALTQSGAQISGIFNKVDNSMKTALTNPQPTLTANSEASGIQGGMGPDAEAGAASEWSNLHGIPSNTGTFGRAGTSTQTRILRIKTIIDENGQPQQLVEAIATSGVEKAEPKNP